MTFKFFIKTGFDIDIHLIFLLIFPIDEGLECYYCQENGGEEHSECTADIIGDPVHCQISDPEKPHYGDVCAVGHVG